MPQAVTTTPHRNDPCPCGSGKKYKNCCRLNAVPSSLPQAEISRLSALLNSGQYPEAESRARQLLERFPMAGVLWKALGLALQLQGGDARQILLRAAQLLPQDAGVFIDLGAAFQLARQLDQAEVAYRRSLAMAPNTIEALNNLGNVLKDLGRLDEAAAHIRMAISIRPDMAPLHDNLGNVLADQGRLEDAIASYRRALQLNPKLPGAHNNSGIALQGLKRFEEAAASYRRALEIRPDYAEAHSNLGNLLFDLGRFEDALASYRRALQLNPLYAEAHSNLGSLLMHMGQIREGEQHLTEAIALSGGSARSLATALSYLSYKKEDPRFQQLEAAYARREILRVPDRIKLDFAVGRALESIGDYERSFAAYEEGNRLHHDRHPFDADAAEAYVERTCRTFTRELFARFSALAGNLPAAPFEPVPIFVVGMPRSGTTLIEQTLASHPAIFGAGELGLLGELARRAEGLSLEEPDSAATCQTLREFGQEYLERARALAAGKAYISDKMPENYQYLWLIRLMLPEAKIIHALRDPLDTCFSCFALPFSSGHEYSYDLGQLGHQYLRYRRLMQHWRTVLPAHSIYDLRYENHVAEPEREARRLLDHLGIAWDPACLRFYDTERAVATSSVAQVRRPMYTSSIARWKHFERYLQPLLQIINHDGSP